MNYLSTRGGDAGLSFQDTVLTGLARDGGLLLPETIPAVSDRLGELSKLDYQSLAFEIIRLFATDIPGDDLRAIIDKSYSKRGAYLYRFNNRVYEHDPNFKM